MSENKHKEYLGDGVYISYDDYHINIAINEHTNHAVALEPRVVIKLKKYFNYIDKLNEKQQTNHEINEHLE